MYTLDLPSYLIIRIKVEELISKEENSSKTISFKKNDFDLSFVSPKYKEIKYDLISSIFHSGSIDCAHYYNYSFENGKWFEFNDSIKKENTPPESGRVCFLVYQQSKCINHFYFFIFILTLKFF